MFADIFSCFFFPQQTSLHQQKFPNFTSMILFLHSLLILLQPTIHSQKSFIDAILGFFSHCPFARGPRTDVCDDLFSKLNDAPPINGTTNLSSACVTNSTALRRKLHSHALPRTSAEDNVIIGSIKVHKEFSSLPYPYPFQRGKESYIPSTLDDMRPNWYYA